MKPMRNYYSFVRIFTDINVGDRYWRQNILLTSFDLSALNIVEEGT